MRKIVIGDRSIVVRDESNYLFCYFPWKVNSAKLTRLKNQPTEVNQLAYFVL